MPEGPIRPRMELLRAPPTRSHRIRTTRDSRPPREILSPPARASWIARDRKEHRGGQGTEGFLRGQEGKGAEAPPASAHRGLRAKSPAVHGAKVMDYEGIKTLPRKADTSGLPVCVICGRTRAIPRGGQGGGSGREGPGVERGCRRAPEEAGPRRRGVDGVGTRGWAKEAWWWIGGV
jgi:hypothetical protein